MPETIETKSKRDIALERLKGRYPEEQFDDDEQVFGRINDDYDQYDQELTGYKEREGKFAEMFTSDPRSARLMMEWRDGDDPAVALVRLYGEDIKDAIDDPEKQEAIATANKEFMERVAKEREYEEQYQRNLTETFTNLENAQSEYGLSDEQVDGAMEWLIAIAKDAMLGKFSPETIAMAIKAQNYDNDVARANAEGEVRGKNTRIQEKLRKPQGGDGMPMINGKNSGGQPRIMPDLGAIGRYGDGNMSIYERGGEKRTPIKR